MQEKQNKIRKNLLNIIMLLNNQGLELKSINSFIDNNLDIVLDEEDIISHIFFIYNGEKLYSIIYTKNNDFRCSIYDNYSFDKLIEYKDDKIPDAIVEMVYNFTKLDKVKEIIPTIDEFNIECKIKCLKKIGFNKKGYHIN